jgi:NAD(P)-dependent dehydrogenase (short-subunit alcohol dehydrogenase family)
VALGIAGLISMPTGSLSGTFRMPALDTLHYGSGSVTVLPAELARLGVTRALVVTGRSIATGTDLVGRVRSLLGDRCAGVFAESRQHVPRSSVLAAVEAARAEGADGIVSLGGGSPIDTAKAVALCLAEDVRQEADLDPLRLRTVAGMVHRPAVAVRAVPHVSLSTTLSAAEFTGIVGITDPGRGCKDLYAADSLAPQVAFLDADLTLPTPVWLWGSTGMRAVDHCIETLCSIRPHPFADALCVRALRMLAEALGSSGEVIYAGAKGGVIAMSKSLAREMARHGITVNVVCPGPTDTPLFHDGVDEKLQAALIRAIPLRRLATPVDVTGAVLYFASASAGYVTGQVLSVSGGLTMSG